jgi:hypothetical protein
MHVPHEFMCYLGICGIQGRQAIRFEENFDYCSHADTKKPKDIHVFNGMAQYYKCFIKNFAFIMVPITKLF